MHAETEQERLTARETPATENQLPDAAPIRRLKRGRARIKTLPIGSLPARANGRNGKAIAIPATIDDLPSPSNGNGRATATPLQTPIPTVPPPSVAAPEDSATKRLAELVAQEDTSPDIQTVLLRVRAAVGEDEEFEAELREPALVRLIREMIHDHRASKTKASYVAPKPNACGYTDEAMAAGAKSVMLSFLDTWPVIVDGVGKVLGDCTRADLAWLRVDRAARAKGIAKQSRYFGALENEMPDDGTVREKIGVEKAVKIAERVGVLKPEAVAA